MSGPEIVTLGCRLNTAESETIRRLNAGASNLIVVNSCAVTNEAVKQTRQAIRRAKRARPDARLVVTGCAAEIDPGMFEAMGEVDEVVGNAAKFISAGQTRAVPVYSDRSRAFVAVQNGCDHRCTFCIIPYGRGPSRSVPAGEVVDRVRALVDSGISEIVLTGVDVTSYGPDLPGSQSLGFLVERILRLVPDLPRLRLSSLDSVEVDARLEEIIVGEPRFMPHLHMSFQAGDDLILKRMKRRHSRAQAVEMVARLKAHRPDLAIGADLIAGFPTETDEMAQNSLRLIDDCDIVLAHIFPYSPRVGTPAARMPQVSRNVIKARASRLREASARRRQAWLAGLVGTRQRVLFEHGGLGHAENFAPVHLTRHPRENRGPASPLKERLDPSFRGNDVQHVRITGVENDVLIGELV